MSGEGFLSTSRVLNERGGGVGGVGGGESNREGSHIPLQSPLFFMGQNKARGAMDRRGEKIYGKSQGSRSQHV